MNKNYLFLKSLIHVSFLLLFFSNISVFASKSMLLAAPANDNFASATDITALINASCTSNGAYTTVGATSDQSKGSCWSGGPSNNVWFKFTATSTGFINLQVKVSGSGETMRYPMTALWSNSSTQLQCQNQQGYGTGATDLSMSYYGLTAGTIYYFSVDNYTSWGNTGKFDICVSDVPDYDYPQGAVDITSRINASCTSGGTYSNQYATADNSKGSCWSGGPYQNRWFKFTATSTTFINVQVKVTGTGETMRYPMTALWNSSLTTQLQCQNQQGYGTGANDLSMSYYGLTPGSVYYIEIDNYTVWGNTGSFDICLSDVPDYDYPQGATDLTSRINASCTSGGTYSNQYATADNNKGSCWSGGPYQNRWFKFTATSTTFINVQVKVTGTGETMRYPMTALWNSSLTTQLQCQNQQGYGTGANDLSMSYYGLTPGNVYYIEIDNYTVWGTTGSFDICLSDVPDYDYPQGATDLTSSINAACASSGVYSNQYATTDNSKGSCWSGGPYQNRWFKFTATSTTFINVQIKVSGASETMRYPMTALWNSSLTTQLQCQNQQGYGTGTNDLSMSYYGLTPGNVYYIEVDNYTVWGSTGSFDICVSDVPDYDYPQGAVDLTSSLNASCTSGGTYSNQYATNDHSAGSCWSGGPYQNRWFKFTATSTTFINVQIKVSGTGETMRYPMTALWNSSLTTQLQCQNQQGYGTGSNDLSMSYYGLTPGNVYYIEVDNYTVWGSTGSFDICVSDVPDYDYPQGAVDLTSTMNGCSTGGTYSNQYATVDNSKGSCWSGGPYQNRWFKFTATSTTFINIQIKVSGTGETMRYPMVALWNSSLTTQLQCQNTLGYGSGAIDLSTSYYGLTPGSVYYIEVDNYTVWGATGTFDICVSNQPDYDYPQGAVVLTNVNNYCSTGATYSNLTATADHNKGSCWSNGPNANRWFTFQAVSTTVTSTVTVNSGQTMRYPTMALWTSTYTTQLACTNNLSYGNGANNITMTYTGLTVGTWYYISVDYYSAWGNGGTFDICINNASSVQYYSIGTGDWSNSANWSTTSYTGTTAGTIPSVGNVVNIQDQTITVSTTQSCDQINMTASLSATGLTVDNAKLTVNGTYNQTNSGVNKDMTTTVQNTGTLTVNDNANFTRSGGNKDFQLNINTGCLMTVGQDIIWTSSGGTSKTNQMNLNGTGILTITRDLTLSSSGGMIINHTLNNSSFMSVGRDITFTAAAASQTQITLNNTSNLNLSRNFVRGTTPYGTFSMASTASLTLNGSGVGHTQNVVGISGSGGDVFNYTNLIINNTSGNNPSVFVTGSATVTGALTLTSGVVNTTSTNLLTLGPGTTSTAGTSATTSYINGPLAIQKNTTGSSTLNFPIGKSTDCRPVILTVNHSTSTLYNYTAQLFNAASTASGYTVFPATVDTMSGVHYWSIGRTDASAVSQPSLDLSGNQAVQLFFGTNDQVYNGSLLTVCKTLSSSATAWYDIGNGSCSIGTGQFSTPQVGSITSSASGPTSFNSFSNFTLGRLYGTGKNPLPIELLYFKAELTNNTADLTWATASETNNDYFTIEKSKDGHTFEILKQIKSEAPNGNSTTTLNYRTYDLNPYEGISYYRLKQTDYNGSFKYTSIVPIDVSKKSFVSVYPNPTSNSIFIHISDDYNNANLKVLDALGREVLTQSIYATSVNTINIGLFNSGIYYVIIDNGNGETNKTKLIVQK